MTLTTCISPRLLAAKSEKGEGKEAKKHIIFDDDDGQVAAPPVPADKPVKRRGSDDAIATPKKRSKKDV